MSIRPGITLPELLVGIFVLGLIVVVIGNLYIGSSQFNRDEQLRIDVGENAARVFANIDPFLRQAKQVLANATINSTLYTTSTDTIVFSLPSIINGTPSQTYTDTGVITPDTSIATIQRLRLIVVPYDDDSDPANDATDSTRSAQDRIVVEHMQDIYLRYNTPIATDATGVTITVNIKKTINQKSYVRSNVLYATFRNRP